MDIYFAGLARDCEDVVQSNLMALTEICHYLCSEIGVLCEIWVAENDSTDNTREEILFAAAKSNLIHPVLVGSIDSQYPRREQRIAFCRDYLLNAITQSCVLTKESVYIPIDLDSGIACSIDPGALRKACKEAVYGHNEAIFPISTPYYYDIYALRASNWSPDDCWGKVRDFRFGGQLGKLLAQLIYVSLRQRPMKSFPSDQLIPINSAFGGLGVYRFESVRGS